MSSLSGSVAIVTGASSGIGLAVAKALAGEGCLVAMAARHAEQLEEACRAVESHGGEAIAVVADVGDEAQVRELVRATLDRWGRVDILVNNAGFGVMKPFLDTSVTELEEQMRTNFLGAAFATRTVLEDMVPRRSGHVVNVASLASRFPLPNYSAYSASKAALDAFSQALRAELSPYGVRVTAVYPSATRTQFFRKAGSARCRQSVARMFMQKPETVAEAIVEALRTGKPEVYPQPGTQLVPAFRAVLSPAFRLVLSALARIYG